MSAEQFQQLVKSGEIVATKKGIKQQSIYFEGDIQDITPVEKNKYDIENSSRLSDDGYYSMDMLNAIKSVTSIFIPGEVFSSKNSHQIFYRFSNKSDCCNADTTGKGADRICLKCKKHCKPKQTPFIDKSKAAKEYDDTMLPTYTSRVEKFRSMLAGSKAPYFIGLLFVRQTRREFDANNMNQAVMDLLVKSGCIPDDNMNVAIPVTLGYMINKTNPGVVIVLLHGDVYYESLINAITTQP